MKIKSKYVFSLVAITAFALFYNQYGWVWNPWANHRLVWDEPNPELIGQTFTITAPATFTIDTAASDGPIGTQGVTRFITLDSGQPLNKPSSQYYRIQPNDVFTVQKTFWIRINAWSKAFHGDRKTAIVIDKTGQKYFFNFLDFHDTNQPENLNIEKKERDISPWNFKKTEILYVKN